MLLADPDSGPPEGADAWLGELPSPVRDAILDAQAAAETAIAVATGTRNPAEDSQNDDSLAEGCPPEGRPAGGHPTEDSQAEGRPADGRPAAEATADGRPVAEPFPAAFLVHDGQGPGGAGFGSGSVLDGLEPGPVLAAALDDAWQAGLNRLPDDELAGLVLGWQRCESRAAAGLLAAVSELSRRREAAGDRQVIEHVDDEIAALLTLTRRSADLLLGLADSLRRLPATMSALRAGRIDRARADVIAYETAMLDAALAAAVEQLVIEDAPSLTTSGLRARVRRAVLAADPDASRRRAENAVRDARVELFDERAGTAGLAGRDLPVPAALAADQRIDAWARRRRLTGSRPLSFSCGPRFSSACSAATTRSPSFPRQNPALPRQNPARSIPLPRTAGPPPTPPRHGRTAW